MLIKIYPDNIDERQLKKAVEILENGGIIIYPTDTVYGIGCDIFNKKAIERIARIKQIDVEKANFSFVCYDLSHLSDYTKPINNNIFRLLKSKLPGAFTFIFEANNNVPKLLTAKKKTVGIRIPDNNIARELVKMLGHPIISTSLLEDEELENMTNPEYIHDKYEKNVDLVIDGGIGGHVVSTIVNCTSNEPEIIRQGKGNL
jgi:tRNA threonylcarbamoyl adenosine modification protein (Sua5/YciO/YrdC/YwlC family)